MENAMSLHCRCYRLFLAKLIISYPLRLNSITNLNFASNAKIRMNETKNNIEHLAK